MGFFVFIKDDLRGKRQEHGRGRGGLATRERHGLADHQVVAGLDLQRGRRSRGSRRPRRTGPRGSATSLVFAGASIVM